VTWSGPPPDLKARSEWKDPVRTLGREMAVKRLWEGGTGLVHRPAGDRLWPRGRK
jgi:hypothetical protein